jgi:hypothetical protein
MATAGGLLRRAARLATGNLLLGSIVALHVALLAWSALVHSPTLNEPGHLAAGVSMWQFGRFDVYRVNPPLVRMVAALPVLAAGVETDWSRFTEGVGARPEFSLGEDLVAANGERSMWLITLARWGCIPFSLLGAWVCYRWASELYGSVAGLLALTLWCFCPNILGHGALMTPDCAATALGAAACYTFWRWLKAPTWEHTLTSGLVLGVAELAKTTLVVFYPLWPLMWLVYRWGNWRQCRRLAPQDEQTSRGARWLLWWRLALRGQSRREAACHNDCAPRQFAREFGMLAVRMVIALYVINLGYGFEGSLTRLGDYRFVSAILGAQDGEEKTPSGGGNRFANSWLAGVPVPLPKNYVLGIDLQRRDFEQYRHPSYLRGEFRDKGWWYYYLYALAIKVPLGTWMLIGLAAFGCRLAPQDAASRGARWLRWRDEFVLLAPAMVILVFVSSQTGFSEHMRYVLPCFPFVFIWIGRLARVLDRPWWSSKRPSPPAPLPRGGEGRIDARWVLAGLSAAALVWSIGSSLWVYPHSLSYFNELVGGPMGGPEHLIHSNVDWGQDLLFLKGWLEEHPEVTRAGSGDPRLTQREEVGRAGSGDPRPTQAGSGDPRPTRPTQETPIQLI